MNRANSFQALGVSVPLWRKSSQINNMMIIRPQVDGAVNPIDHIAAMARQHGCDIDAALLQGLTRVKQIKSALDLAMHCFVTSHLGALKARAQPIDLIVDLAPAFFQSLGQRRVDATQLFLQTIQLVIESRGRMIESL